MPVKIDINIAQQEEREGAKLSYRANPTGDTTQDEIDTANAVVAICELLGNEEFQVYVAPWVEATLVRLHCVQDGYKEDSGIVH